MKYAAHIGRVGGLAVALGIGLAIGGPAGMAWADTGDSTQSESSSESQRDKDSDGASVDTGERTPGKRSSAAPSTSRDKSDDDASAAADEGTAEAEVSVSDRSPGRHTKKIVVERDSLKGLPSDPPADGPDTSEVLALMASTFTARREVASTAAPRTDYQVSSVGVGRGPSTVALNSDGSRAYVANSAEKSVSVVETASGVTVVTVRVDGSASAVALNPTMDRAYVALKSAAKLAVVDTRTNTVTASVSVGWSPSAVAVNSTGTRVYVSNAGSGTMSVIDTATNKRVAVISLGSTPAGLAVSPNGSRVYVAVRGSDRVSVVDTSTNRVVAKVKVADSPTDVVVSPDGSRVYAVHSSGSLSVVNAATNAVRQSGIWVGASTPSSVALTADGSKLFVANASDTVYVLDTDTNVADSFQIDDLPEAGEHDIAISASGDRIYVTDTADRMLRLVTATIVQNSAPELMSGPTVEGPHAADGSVPLTFLVRDPDGDPLTHNVSRMPTGGGVIVSTVVGPYETRYTVNYTPTEAARLAARQTPGEDFDTFTITVGDGVAQTDVPVSVRILPAVPTLPTTGATRIAVGPRPVNAFIVGTRLYVTNGDDGSVTVVDTATNRVVTTVPGVDVRYRGIPITASADGRYLYASHYVGYDATASIAVLDTTTGALIATVVMPKCVEECWAHSGGITDMEIAPDGASLYASEYWLYGGTVTTVDTATNTVVGHHPGGDYGDYFAELELTADGTTLYAGPGYPYSPHIEVVDPKTMGVTKYIPLTGLVYDWAPSVGSMELSPNGKRLVARITEYDPSVPSETIVIVDTDPASASYHTHVATVTVSAGAVGVQISADSSRAFVTHDGGRLLTVIDLATNTVTGTVPSSRLGGDYSALAVGANGTLYFTNATDNAVYAVTL